MTINRLTIDIEFEQFVRVRCTERKCIHNLMDYGLNGMTACNLKNIMIGGKGQCLNFEPKPSGKDSA